MNPATKLITPSTAGNALHSNDLAIRIGHFGYSSERAVLRDVHLNVPAQGTGAVLGVSGCGKSTLLRIIAGILPREPTHVFAGSVSMFGRPPEEYRELGKLAVMFQEPTLFPNRSVRENVALPLELMKRSDNATVDRLLGRVGLANFADILPRALSGGMRTRVALARSFVSAPEILLLDEPFAALDLAWKRELYDALHDLTAQSNATVIMVTHDLQEAVYNANVILVLGSDGTPLDTLFINRPLPRQFDFADTIAQLTPELDYLAHLISFDGAHAYKANSLASGRADHKAKARRYR